MGASKSPSDIRMAGERMVGPSFSMDTGYQGANSATYSGFAPYKSKFLSEAARREEYGTSNFMEDNVVETTEPANISAPPPTKTSTIPSPFLEFINKSKSKSTAPSYSEKLEAARQEKLEKQRAALAFFSPKSTLKK